MTTLPKNSRQNSENHFLKFRKRWKIFSLFKQKYFSSGCSSEHAQWIFGKPEATLLPRIRKTFPNSKNVQVTIFWTKLLFFTRNVSLATENAILTTTPKKFLRKTTDLTLRFQKGWKKLRIFWKKNIFPQNVPMYM